MKRRGDKDKRERYEEVKRKTQIEETGNTVVEGYIIRTVDRKGKEFSYWIPQKILKKWMIDILEEVCLIGGRCKVKDLGKIMEKEIYTIYRTKTAVERIILFILNYLVLQGIFEYNWETDEYILLQDLEKGKNRIEEQLMIFDF